MGGGVWDPRGGAARGEFRGKGDRGCEFNGINGNGTGNGRWMEEWYGG